MELCKIESCEMESCEGNDYENGIMKDGFMAKKNMWMEMMEMIRGWISREGELRIDYIWLELLQL